MVLSCVDGPFDARAIGVNIDRCGMRSCVRPVCAFRGPYGLIALALPAAVAFLPRLVRQMRAAGLGEAVAKRRSEVES